LIVRTVLFYPVRSTVSRPSQLSILTDSRLLVYDVLLKVILKVFNKGHCEISTYFTESGIVKLEIIPRLENLILSSLLHPEIFIFSKNA
jgi:hypothetical protein